MRRDAITVNVCEQMKGVTMRFSVIRLDIRFTPISCIRLNMALILFRLGAKVAGVGKVVITRETNDGRA